MFNLIVECFLSFTKMKKFTTFLRLKMPILKTKNNIKISLKKKQKFSEKEVKIMISRQISFKSTIISLNEILVL